MAAGRTRPAARRGPEPGITPSNGRWVGIGPPGASMWCQRISALARSRQLHALRGLMEKGSRVSDFSLRGLPPHRVPPIACSFASVRHWLRKGRPWRSALHATPGVSLSRGGPTARPLVAETVLVVAAVAALLPLFGRVAVDATGRDQRYAECDRRGPRLAGPHAALAFARRTADLRSRSLRERLCRRAGFGGRPGSRPGCRLRWPTLAPGREPRFSRRSGMRRRASRNFACSSARAWATCSR